MAVCTLRVTGKTGRPLAGRATLVFEDKSLQEDQFEVNIGANGVLTYDDAEMQTTRLAVVCPTKAGVWTSCATDFGNADTIVCPSIDEDGISWWHSLLGSALEDETRGTGVRIGVIDLGFEPDDSLAHVEILSAPDAERPRPAERWSHGEAVCRILGDATAPRSCAPIAPGAELVFANAVFTQGTQRDEDFTFPQGDGDAGDYLDPRLVTSFIYEMAFGGTVDIINLSLGSFEMPKGAGAGLADAIQTAVEAGVTVICAAGNQPRNGAAFPAKLDTAIGVGAFGQGDWGPDGSLARHYAGDYPRDGHGVLLEEDIFIWSDSAYGSGVDVIGPGVGILIAREGAPAFDLTGTSFAAPIVAGLLAVELAKDSDYLGMARDEARSDYARRRLIGLAQKTHMSRRYEQHGAVCLDAADF